MQEGFQIRAEALDAASGVLDDSRTNNGSIAGVNIWPDVPGFRESLLQY